MDFGREEIIATFVAESEEGLQRMEEALLAAEANPKKEGLLDDIFRVAHTIKGNSLILEFGELAGFAHVVEDLLDILREQQASMNKEVASLLLKAVDELRLMVPAAAAGKLELTPQQQQLKKKIAKAAHGRAQKPASAGFSDSPSTEPAVKSEAIPNASARTLRADVAKLDRMLDLTGEIVIIQGRLRRMLEDLQTGPGRAALEVHEEAERLFLNLQEEVMRVRMVPVGPMFRQLARSVRDIAAGHGKIARLEISGADVEVDTTVLEHLKDSLLHMIRNAVDHGIQKPEVREREGKDACGLITLSAIHSSGSIIVKLEDDGAGLDRNKILEKAKRMGLLAAGERISDQELYRLLFRAGFSTTDSVSDLSGRGVGLDVVQRNIESLRGTVDITSEPGKSTTVTLRLPLTLTIIDGFSVAVGHDTFVIPLDYVTECTELTLEERSEESSGIFNLRGKAVPYVRLRQAFQTRGDAPVRENIVVVKVDEFFAGIAVDGLLGGMRAVIKPLGMLFRSASGIAGSTVLGDGSVGLILDVPGLLRQLMQSKLQTQLS